MHYKNKYGEATLTLVGPIMSVKEVVGSKIIDDGYGFDDDAAGKLALITENRRLQQACNMARRKWYVVYHHDEKAVQVCRLDALVSNETDPFATLDRLNRCGW